MPFVGNESAAFLFCVFSPFPRLHLTVLDTIIGSSARCNLKSHWVLLWMVQKCHATPCPIFV
jgi:hypothetical protein